MPQIWRKTRCQWTVQALSSARVELRDDAESPVVPCADGAARGPVVMEARVGSQSWWALLASRTQNVRVNGDPVELGLRVLQHRDAIRLGSDTELFFSTEKLPTVTAFEGTDRPTQCARCKGDLKRGDPVVVCPGCGAVHHQSEDYPCWTYADTCACCPQGTELNAEYSWTPEEL